MVNIWELSDYYRTAKPVCISGAHLHDIITSLINIISRFEIKGNQTSECLLISTNKCKMCVSPRRILPLGYY